MVGRAQRRTAVDQSVHAPAPVLPQENSPYHPSSRRYRNPLYLRIENLPGGEMPRSRARGVGPKAGRTQ